MSSIGEQPRWRWSFVLAIILLRFFVVAPEWGFRPLQCLTVQIFPLSTQLTHTLYDEVSAVGSGRAGRVGSSSLVHAQRVPAENPWK